MSLSDLPEMPEEQIDIKGRPSRARYDKVRHELDRKWRRRELKSGRMMKEVVDMLWDAFWRAVFLVRLLCASAGRPDLVLGPHRDKPALALPMHGVCGQVAKTGKAMLVPDVGALGDAHVECDPKNKSEIAVPVFDRDGKVIAVFDVDSEQPAAFDEMDQRWLERILKSFQDVGKVE